MSNLAVSPSAGSIIAPDGSRVERPTIELSAETAQILRTYFAWAMRASLEPELFCAACFDHSRSAKILHTITDNHIALACACRIRFYPLPTKAKPVLSNGVSISVVEGEPAQIALPVNVARLLRSYKQHVLQGLGLCESLRCNACFELNLSDGCNAVVTNEFIQIVCRCSDRTYRGITI